ncbi:MAG: molybdopterin-dependent oxidoreductase [bacterium]|nr:molybdopterin-dependent oxidoreductase [bacterium]
MTMISVNINGKQHSVPADLTILQICKDLGIDNIPTLCHDPKLPPFGSCFLCVVEVEGQSRLFPACSTKPSDGMKIHTRSDKVIAARKTCLELLLSDHYADCFGPCRLNCPADVDIQGYMSLINLGKFKEAVALIKEKNPLPSVCGRVCTRKCEINCRRTLVDAPVGIDFLKRYAADQDMIGQMWQPDTKPDNGQPVAIIGAGPAGLTAAYYLVLEGYRPTIFEALPNPGGMLRYGIPEYRLPKEILDKEINWILDLGVELHTNKMLGRDITIDGLFKQGFKSVFIGLGAQVGKPMAVENENVDGVLTGVDFLRQVELKTNPPIKGRVVVVGGGNTAIDAARTSLRLGADEVILLYRRTRNEMPANMVEIEAAEHEGIRMEFLAAPVRVNVANDRMESITCIRMELGEPDASGRRRPVEVKDSDFTLNCDWVISAIGQEPDLTGVESKNGNVKVTKWKTIVAKEGTFDTDRPGVFSGGDVVTGPADAIDAIAAGRMAARAIDKFIRTGIVEPFTDRFESKRDNFHKMTRQDIPQVQESHRHHAKEMPVEKRIRTFEEVEYAYDEKDAFEESLRCAECGCDVGLACTLQDYCTEYGVDQTRFVGEYNKYKVDTRHPFIKLDANKCIRCGRCVNTCAEILNVSALGFVNRGFRTIVKPAMEKALHETNCVSCGNCIDVCPTGALVEKMPFRRSGPWKMDSVENICNYCSVGCNLTLKVKTNDIFYVAGASPETEPNHGELCVKGRFGYQHYLDGSRVTKPMIKRGGKQVQTSWNEAFDAIESGLQKVIEDYSPDEILVAASPKLTNEELYLAGRFARAALGTNNIVSFHQLLNDADYHALDDMFGATLSTATNDDVANADLYLFLGGNPTSENPVLGWQMKRRMKHGTQAIVINSSQIDLTTFASVWGDARRGTATTLLNGVMGELIRRGKIDSEYLKTKTVNADQVIAALAKTDLTEVASITGVSIDSIRKMADLLADPSKKIVAWYNLDSRVERASNDLKALATLMLLLGRIGKPGNGIALMSSQANHTGSRIAGFDSKLLPGGGLIDNSKLLAETSKVWRTDMAKLLEKSGTNVSRKLRQDKIRAAVIIGENPAASPEFNALINHLDFLVVADLFQTETAMAADVFIPLSSYLETEGHLTNWSGMRQATTPIGEPLNGLSTRAIIERLCEDMGHHIGLANFDELVSEIEFMMREANCEGRINGSFLTPDGKAHLVLYSDQVMPTRADQTQVIELDRRITDRMKLIKA